MIRAIHTSENILCSQKKLGESKSKKLVLGPPYVEHAEECQPLIDELLFKNEAHPNAAKMVLPQLNSLWFVDHVFEKTCQLRHITKA